MLVIFDIGETLVRYKGVALNWSEHYECAIEQVLQKLGLQTDKEKNIEAIEILSFYNTRVNPRSFEVSEGEVIPKIANLFGIEKSLFEDLFFTYFQRRSELESTALQTLIELKKSDISIAALTDSAYGMPKRIIKKDISKISKYIDKLVTSCDIGTRKPNPKGIHILKDLFIKENEEVFFIGNEQKDIDCAKNANVKSVLIDESCQNKFGQDYTIKELRELQQIIL